MCSLGRAEPWSAYLRVPLRSIPPMEIIDGRFMQNEEAYS